MQPFKIRLALALACVFSPMLLAADAPVQPPEIAAEHTAALVHGDAYAAKAATTVDALKTEVAQLRAALAAAMVKLAQAEADKQAAVTKALTDYKASLGLVPFPSSP